MALPAEFNTIPVHGKYVDLSGAVASGSVEFAPSSVVTAPSSDTIILPKILSVALDNAGNINIALPATDDPDISVEFSYMVTEKIDGQSPRSYVISVPVSTVGILELSDLAPLPAPTPAQQNYLLHGVILPTGAPLPVLPDNTLVFRR